MTQKLKLDVSVDEANVILKGLTLLPYGEVAGVIASIKAQGDTQVAEQNKPVQESAVPTEPQLLKD